MTNWRYSMHQDSLFVGNPFSMNLGLSYSLIVFRKHYTCQHKFGCIEAFLRQTFKTMTIWMLSKGLFELISGFDLGQEAINLVKDNCESVAKNLGEEDSKLAWFGFQALMITGFSLFAMRRCLKHIFVQS